MSRCEDWPCCGHEPGGCPDPDGRFKCARCGGRLPRRATSAVCARCHAQWRRSWASGDDDRADRADGDLALREAGPSYGAEALRWTTGFIARAVPGGKVRITARGGALPRSRTVSAAAWRELESYGDQTFDAACVWDLGVGLFQPKGGDLALREGPAVAPAASRRGRKPMAVRGTLMCPADVADALKRPEAPLGEAEQEAWLARTWFVIGRYGRWTGDLALREGPAAAPAAPMGGWRVETWGGGRYTTVAWYARAEEAEAYAGWLTRYGYWRGMPPRVVVDKGRCGE